MEIDIDAEKFRTKGNSKLIRLFSFLKTSPPKNAGEVLRALYDHKTAAQRNDLRASMAFSSYTMDNIELIDAQQTALNLEDEDFEIFVSAIECRKEDQVAEHLTIVADHFDFDTVVREITRARDFVENDPEDAITAACSLLEAVCRSILIELKLELPKDISLKQLYRAVRGPLKLDPKTVDSPELISSDVRAILAAMASLVDGIAALRTHAGDAHGKAAGTKRIDARIARLAINSSNSVALFLIETWSRHYPDRRLAHYRTLP